MLAAAAPSDGRLPAAGAGEGTAATGLGLLSYCAPVRWRGWDGQTPLMARGRRTTSGRYLFTASGPPCSLLALVGLGYWVARVRSMDARCRATAHGHVIYYSVLCTTPCKATTNASRASSSREPHWAAYCSIVRPSLSLSRWPTGALQQHACMDAAARRTTTYGAAHRRRPQHETGKDLTVFLCPTYFKLALVRLIYFPTASTSPRQ
jgi:hypothetical protein